MTFRRALEIIMGALRGQKPKRRRICGRCGRQIKRGEHWQAKVWTDHKPRHSDVNVCYSAPFAEGMTGEIIAAQK